ncbi:unnamed protein product [Medioppia subpectinata]|uniref:Transcription elongation factor S-II n=1 Tax=Medioppia subpectinata TaxID=1979941 RepID=A0A7R9QDX8_9ACAR|nr:unnamed protein product [Medioppia subpectinata]CAG2119079.1 unnamed protein product [Medioppia subpectinata]
MDSILRYGIRDETRLKSRELLLKSLLPNNEELKDDIFRVVKLAVEIEKHIFQEFQNTDNKYKTRVRSRIANLSDEQNASLRYRVLKGTVTVKEIATMSAEDMASDRMKQMRQQFHDEAIAANLLPEVFGTTCDLLKCPKCKSNTCTYSQVQIERADEPMTTLCLCITCGYRWRYD